MAASLCDYLSEVLLFCYRIRMQKSLARHLVRCSIPHRSQRYHPFLACNCFPHRYASKQLRSIRHSSRSLLYPSESGIRQICHLYTHRIRQYSGSGQNFQLIPLVLYTFFISYTPSYQRPNRFRIPLTRLSNQFRIGLLCSGCSS